MSQSCLIPAASVSYTPVCRVSDTSAPAALFVAEGVIRHVVSTLSLSKAPKGVCGKLKQQSRLMRGSALLFEALR